MAQNFLNKKNLYIIIAVIILVVVISIIYALMQQNNSNTAQPTNNQNQTTNNNPTTSNTATPTASLSYQQALKAYTDKRIQFNINYNGACVAVPIHSVFKNGTKIMLDNRSAKTLTITLDGAVSNIKAYDFKIVTLSTKSTLPHTTKVDCNGSKGVSQLILQ